MFSDVSLISSWLFSEVSGLAQIVYDSGWVGVCIIGIGLARAVVYIFRKLL